MTLLEPVDRLEFQVLIDNVTDSLSTSPPNVTLEWPALMRATGAVAAAERAEVVAIVGSTRRSIVAAQ